MTLLALCPILIANVFASGAAETEGTIDGEISRIELAVAGIAAWERSFVPSTIRIRVVVTSSGQGAPVTHEREVAFAGSSSAGRLLHETGRESDRGYAERVVVHHPQRRFELIRPDRNAALAIAVADRASGSGDADLPAIQAKIAPVWSGRLSEAGLRFLTFLNSDDGVAAWFDPDIDLENAAPGFREYRFDIAELDGGLDRLTFEADFADEEIGIRTITDSVDFDRETFAVRSTGRRFPQAPSEGSGFVVMATENRFTNEGEIAGYVFTTERDGVEEFREEGTVLSISREEPDPALFEITTYGFDESVMNRPEPANRLRFWLTLLAAAVVVLIAAAAIRRRKEPTKGEPVA